jgi:ATP-dependent DNA helicase PIF1
VKFDDPIAGNSLKDRRLRNELKECVPITAITKKFPLTKGKSTVVAERRQFPLILGHAITIHKSQGSTLDYMKGDINRSTGKKTKTGKEYQQPVSQGQFYTLLSRAKSRDKVLLLNFEPEHIKVNRPALEEMERMREESLFLWKHPLI